VSPSAPGFSRAVAARELHRIAAWWLENALDTAHGGFVGQVGHDGRRAESASKGIVLNARILWFFSEIARFDERRGYRDAAARAFAFLLDRFDDPGFGGAAWKITAEGAPIDARKRVYAQAFCILAFSAWYRLTGDPLAGDKALEYFGLIEERARDRARGGYREAFTPDWRPLEDTRLGATDLRAPRSMNVHLHVLEAYSALHRALPSPSTEAALRGAVDILCDRVFDPGTGHLSLYFDADWRRLSRTVSFGHDIEASWLLWEAADTLADTACRDRVRPIVERLAERTLQAGLGSGGQLCDSFDPVTGVREEAAIWWVQAEALVGFLNAYQVTGLPAFRAAVDRVWQFIEKHLLDAAAGEWHWQHPAGPVPHYKAGFWKGPYHNGRAMLEACRRFDALGET